MLHMVILTSVSMKPGYERIDLAKNNINHGAFCRITTAVLTLLW